MVKRQKKKIPKIFFDGTKRWLLPPPSCLLPVELLHMLCRNSVFWGLGLGGRREKGMSFIASCSWVLLYIAGDGTKSSPWLWPQHDILPGPDNAGHETARGSFGNADVETRQEWKRLWLPSQQIKKKVPPDTAPQDAARKLAEENLQVFL